MTYVLLAVIALLVFDRLLSMRAQDRREQRQGAFDKSTVDVIDAIHARSARQVSEMATRIAHPEILRPDISEEPDVPVPPMYDDEFDLVGKVLPDEPEMNGGGE